jgi:hypothetical protein
LFVKFFVLDVDFRVEVEVEGRSQVIQGYFVEDLTSFFVAFLAG